MGMRQRIATSCARSIFVIVSGHPDPGHHACAGCLAVVTVICDEQSELDEASAIVAESSDPLARRELSLLVLALDLVRPAALAQPVLEGAELAAELSQSTGAHVAITLPASSARRTTP